MWLTLFILSFSINILAIFYLRWLLLSLKTMGEDLGALTDSVAQFASHLKGVYELEMFYGDETLKSLFSHATELVEELEKVDFLLEPEDEEEDELESQSEEKEIFYAGN